MGGGQGAQATKGVGGYRPTINWREISVRRRSVAAKQVLACIIASGVLIVAGGVILTILGFLVIASQCPFMWEGGAGSCYYLAPHNATWGEGRAYCTSQSASLLHLRSAAEADFIKGRQAGRSWLGARRKMGKESSWEWVSGPALNYSRWLGDTLPTSLEQDLCAAVEVSGEWVALECAGEETAYVICDYVPGYNPFMLVGPVVVACGVVVLVLSVEVCVRRREFMVKNPEAAITDDQDDDRQVDPGLINYGYGHYEEGPTPRPSPRLFPSTRKDPSRTSQDLATPKDPSTPKPLHTPSKGAPRVKHVVVSPRSEEEEEKEEEKEEEEEEEEEGESPGPKVQVVPASPSSLTPPTVEENTHSQEQLELLLSPKTLE